MASKGQKFKKWSKEDKLRIVKRHINEHVSIRALSKEEGVNNSLITVWVKRYTEEGEHGLEPKKRGNPSAALNTGKNLSEVERLRLIVAKQEIEIERFKKGYMVKGDRGNQEYVTSNDVTMKIKKINVASGNTNG